MLHKLARRGRFAALETKYQVIVQDSSQVIVMLCVIAANNIRASGIEILVMVTVYN